MKIVDIKTKIIPSNPRSKNYPIGYSGGIASNSNGVTPDLSIYLLKEIWERNIEERTDESGNEYLYIRKPLAIGGGATMYASDGTSVPSIFDGLPLDNQTIWKNPTTGKIEVIGGAGSSFDENAMWSALSGSSDNQINKSHLTTALDGYATQNWVIENYATKSELSAVSNKLNDFLEGSDTDTIINKWKELEAFLSGMAETDNLAEILETKADKKYVDSTFVTLATKQTITGEKTFSSVLNTAAIKASGEITTPSLAASDYVTIAGIKLRKLEDGALMLEGNLALTGGLTTYASDGVSFASIYDGLPIDNDTIYWQEVEGSKVLKAKEGSGSSFDKSAMWTALAGSTTEQINKSHLTTALTGYATESWVSGKNYAVKATTLAGYGITDAYTKTESDSKYPTKTGSGASGTWGINVTGNAGSATKLQTARTLWGQSFDGTKNVSGDINNVGNINFRLEGKLVSNGSLELKYKNDDTTSLTFTGTVFRPFTSAHNNIDLGASTVRWRDLYIGRNAYVDGITKTEDFYIGGIRLHKTADGVITLEGNLAVTGGVTMYAIDPVSASTIMDGVVVDGTTIKKENGKLVAVGGGEAGSVAWGNISGKPSVYATNIANITDLHSSWDAVLKAQKPNWLTAVSIATISDLNSGWDALLKAAPSAYVTRWPTISEVKDKQDLVIKLNGGTTEGTNQFTYNATAAKSLNITASSVGAYTKSESDSRYPTKTGSGASGTWGINISGTASNADKLDNYHESSFFRARDIMNSSNIDTFALRENGTYLVNYDGYSGMLSVFKYGTGSVYSMEILSPYYETSHGLKFRYVVDGARYTNWRSFAFEDGNVYSATKLQNKRYFWGQGFDGTTDVTGIIEAYNGIQLPYGKQIQTEYGTLLTSGYNLESGYNDFFQLTAIGANKIAKSLVGGNSGRLVWEGNQFIIAAYDGGWYMSDSNFIRSYQNKSVYIGSGSYVNAGGNAYSNNIENISEPNNYRYVSETAYSIPTGYIHPFCGWSDSAASGWTTSYVIGSIRNYANNWGEMYFGVYQYEGASRAWKAYMALDGVNRHLYVDGNLMVTGGGTFYGSDIRYKSIIQQIKLSLLDIAEAPSFVYRWNKKEMICDRLNIGGSAQYTQTILPWAVEEKNNLLTMDYATVAYTFSVHTARHLLDYETKTDKEIRKLKNRIKYLEKQLKKLGYEEVRTLDDQSV